MNPVRRVCGTSSTFQDESYTMNFGSLNTAGSLIGNVKNMGEAYADSLIVYFNKSGFKFIKAVQPKSDGSYKLQGLASDINGILICLDKSGYQNALVFDRISPK